MWRKEKNEQFKEPIPLQKIHFRPEEIFDEAGVLLGFFPFGPHSACQKSPSFATIFHKSAYK